MTINAHRHGVHAVPTERQWMLRPGLVRGRPTIARCQPVKQHAGAVSRPAVATSQATVAPVPPHYAAPVTTPQLASSSPLGATFVVNPSSRVATPVVPLAQTPSQPVDAALQAKMVAPAHSSAGLLLPAIEPAYPR